jgi:hypothetical protein
MEWVVEVVNAFLPEFNELAEEVRTEILAVASAIWAAIR